ncbi:hypothetical protein [Paenibacillus oleatilyticus]|uniref:Uncharacterized protein n=1 Tax=Paenibacillus oleatilyticus TaxID=2594886 RepID=A0ABV4USG0_9BACL
MDIDKKALNILLSYDLLCPEKTSKEDFEYAKRAGLMFDKVELTHDEAIQLAIQEMKNCDKKHIINLFLASLSTDRLDWRTGLSAYTIMRMFPSHSFQGNERYCDNCSYLYRDIVDLSFINGIRFDVGGIISGNIYAFHFMLSEHNKLPNQKPNERDFTLFRSILNTLENAATNDGPSKLEKEIKKIDGFKSTKESRKALLETLGFCSILETEEHKGFLHKFTNLGLAPRLRHSSDWLYPVDWWKGKEGINRDALHFWFGDYEELSDLFAN